jgi:hypothetical protein
MYEKALKTKRSGFVPTSKAEEFSSERKIEDQAMVPGLLLDSKAIRVLVAVVVVVPVVAALSGFFQLMTLLLRLPAVLAVFANGLLQVVLSFVDSLFALPVQVNSRRESRATENHRRRDEYSNKL